MDINGYNQMATVTTNMNYLQPTNFKVVINHSTFGNLEFFAQRIIHPGVSVQAPSVAYKRISSISVPGDTLTFEDLSMDILVDENMQTYIEVFDLLNSLVETNYKSPMAKATSIGTSQELDITLTITSSHNNVVRTIRYIDCVPTSIGTILMEATSETSPVITFPVTFMIGYYEIK